MRRRRTDFGRRSGFTLIETIATIVVLATLLGGMLSMVVVFTSHAVRAAQKRAVDQGLR